MSDTTVDKPDPEAAPVRAFITRWAPVFGESPLFKHTVAAYRAAWNDDSDAGYAGTRLMTTRQRPRALIVETAKVARLVGRAIVQWYTASATLSKPLDEVVDRAGVPEPVAMEATIK